MTAPLSGVSCAAVAVLFAASAATGQLPVDHVQVAGVGAIRDSIDVQGATGNALCLGVVHLDGHYYVSGGGGGASNRVYVLDEGGDLMRDFPQIATTAFGYRDGATDGVSLMFGSEAGLHVIDQEGNAVTTVIAANGPQTVTAPITGETLSTLNIYRAVAYNPNGNGGDGSVWTASFGSALIECDLDGAILTNLPNNAGWSIYGLAWDPLTQTLLANSVPNAGEIAQIDPTTGDVLATFGRLNPGSAQGGLSPVVGKPRPGNGAFGADGSWDVVGLDQTTPDTITRYRVHLWRNNFRNGFEESRLLTATGDDTPDAEPIKTMIPGGTISLLVEPPTLSTVPAFLFMNAGADALVNGTTALGRSHVLQEFVVLTGLSTPTGTDVRAMTQAGRTLRMSVPLLTDLDFLRVQALTINSAGHTALTATNQMFFQLDAARILVEAQGSNSFNSVTDSGFFRVHHRFGSPIKSVEFDWVASSNSGQSTMRFDTNQTGMADVFDAGNSSVSTCLGTYRNGSDAATGLVYDAANTAPTSSCAVSANANTGWIGSNPGTITGDYRTLTFRFAGGEFSGRTFEFDVDTDGGVGINGGAMDGMVVTITLEDNSVLRGELAEDPSNGQRSFLRFL